MAGVGRWALLVVALVAWHLPWASGVTGPYDWDPSYYLGVARAIAEGRGAVTDAVWAFGWLPDTLVHPADLHWMPAASRWLVPWLWLPLPDWRAAQLATGMLALGWAWLGVRFAERWGASPGVATLAGLAAGLGGGWARWLVLPDSAALYGFVGGAALLEVARGRAARAAVWLALAALTRADGFLLAVACGLAWPGRRWLALVGPAVTGLWALRNAGLVGEAAWAMRARAASALRPEDWFVPGPVPAVGLGDRLGFVVEHLPDLGRVGLLATLGVLLPFVLLGAWRAEGADPGRRALLGYALLAPPLMLFLAPAVAYEGSMFRSVAAAFPGLVALAVLGAAGLTRRYHPLFLAGALVATFAGVSFVARKVATPFVNPFDDCAALAEAGVPAGAALFSYDPLGTSTRCRHPGIILAKGLTAADVDALSARYEVRWLLTAPEGYASWTRGPADVDLPGWQQVGERVWRR